MKLKRRTCRCGEVILWGRTQGGAPIPLQEEAICIEPSKDGKVFAITSEGKPLRGNKTDKGGVRVRESHYAYCPKAAEIKAEVRRRLAAKKKRDDGPHPNAPKERRVNACDKCGCPLEFVHVGGRFRGGPEEGRMVGGRWVAVEPGKVLGVALENRRPWELGLVQFVVESQGEDEPKVITARPVKSLDGLRRGGEDEPEYFDPQGVSGRQIHRCGGGL